MAFCPQEQVLGKLLDNALQNAHQCEQQVLNTKVLVFHTLDFSFYTMPPVN